MEIIFRLPYLIKIINKLLKIIYHSKFMQMYQFKQKKTTFQTIKRRKTLTTPSFDHKCKYQTVINYKS